MSWEKEFKEKCDNARIMAMLRPVEHLRLAADNRYLFQIQSPTHPFTTYHIRLFISKFTTPPMLDSSISFVTDYPDTENKFGQPDEGTPFCINWTDEQKKEARQLLDQLLDPYIRRTDDTQQILVTWGSTHLQLQLIYEPEKLERL